MDDIVRNPGANANHRGNVPPPEGDRPPHVNDNDDGDLRPDGCAPG